MYRSLTAFGMTTPRRSVIPSGARDLYLTPAAHLPPNWRLANRERTAGAPPELTSLMKSQRFQRGSHGPFSLNWVFRGVELQQAANERKRAIEPLRQRRRLISQAKNRHIAPGHSIAASCRAPAPERDKSPSQTLSPFPVNTPKTTVYNISGEK